jgi:predicted naringenin-chalcone synthase
MYLHHFHIIEPPFKMPQQDSVEWLSRAWAKKQNRSASDLKKAFSRIGCTSSQIHQRGYFLPEFNSDEADWKLLDLPMGRGHGARSAFFAETCDAIFHQTYEQRAPPEHLIHVTCTGYSSPSPAQKISAERWSGQTEILHAYHMGCYASVPALRMARGLLKSSPGAVDIFHTELCTLHIDLYEESLEQMVIQTLFADGAAVYRMSLGRPSSGFEFFDARERIIPNSAEAMSWVCSDFGLKMSLSKDVPKYIGTHLKSFLDSWLEEKDFGPVTNQTIFAIHPGGPKIVEFARQALDLKESQVRFSRQVLEERGNMSSATLPHIWSLILESPEVISGTDIVSIAFGPGLTVAATRMKKL